MFSNHFDMLMSNMIFKKLKKYHFNAFSNKKHLKKTTITTLSNTLKYLPYFSHYGKIEDV